MNILHRIIAANVALILSIYGIAMPITLFVGGGPVWPYCIFFAFVWLGTFIGCGIAFPAETSLSPKEGQ